MKFINEVVQRSTGTVGELLSANWSIVDSTLAPVYGVTSAGATAHTTLPKRLGILNQGAFLSVFAHASETAPVLRGVAVMRRVACMKHARSARRSTSWSCRRRPTRRSRRASASTSTPPTPPARPATTPSTRSASPSSSSTAWARSARPRRRRARSRTRTSAQRQADQRRHDQQHDHRQHRDFPSDFAGSYADSNALATALAGSAAGARVPGAADVLPSSAGRSDDVASRTPSSRFVDVWNQLPARPAGEVHRGPGRLRAQPAVRPTERAMKKPQQRHPPFVPAAPSAPARRRCRSTACSRTRWRRRPARRCRCASSASTTRTASRPSTGRCRPLLGLADTETNFDLTYANNGAQCSLQPFDDAATYGKSFKNKILAIEGDRSHVERQRPRHGRHHPHRQPHRSSARSRRTPRSTSSWRSSEAGRGDARSPASRSASATTAPSPGTTLSFGPGGAPLPKIIDPVQAFNTLFANFVPTNDPAAAAAAMRQRALGQERDRLRERRTSTA